MTNKELADLLLPGVDADISRFEKQYPPRDLPAGAMVVRVAPSPTGFIHMGTLVPSALNRKLATDTKGVFFLRIEDTDQKRQIENGIQDIVDGLKNFGIEFDEGPINETEEKGEYGPYIQSHRKDIYQSYAKYLLEQGKAYPCFCTPEQIEETRTIQEKKKQRIGYYGRFAKCRQLSLEEMSAKVKAGESFIIRLKSKGDFDNRIKVQDLIKGTIEFPENDLDTVLLKSTPSCPFLACADSHLHPKPQLILSAPPAVGYNISILKNLPKIPYCWIEYFVICALSCPEIYL